MLRYLQRRLILSIPILILISLIVFFIMHILPGDPVKIMLAGQPVSGDVVTQLRHEYGLDRPVYLQYLTFAGHALRGDLGRSIHTQRPVTQEIIDQFPSTLELTFAGMAIAIVIGVVSGVLAAMHQGGWVDALSMFVALLGVSMPSFWLALLLLIAFSFRLHWFPAVGGGDWRHLVLPAFVLGVGEAAVIARLVRASMVEVLRQEYVTVARAKGLANRVVVLRHAMRNAMIPVVTVLGLQYGFLLGGAVIVETVFSRPGIGRLAVDAILAKDYPMVQGVVLFSAVIYVIMNLLVDISYAVFDPRIHYE
jgi:ABC-type dipeptide/oligopeptide/nickel transport system permease component